MKNKKSKAIKKRNGQVVVEYVLVLAMIVGVSVVVYRLLKVGVQGPLTTVKGVLEGDTNALGKSAGSGNKTSFQYYQNVRFGVKNN
jgi:hypothetical protein